MSFAHNLKYLMDQYGLSNYQLAKELECHQTSVANWLNGTMPQKKMQKEIADYFQVSINQMNSDVEPCPSSLHEKEKAPVLNEKDRRDIARDLDNLMDKLEGSGDLMFDGDPMSDEAKESLRAAMKLGLEAAKVKNKERFTPKKYRGKE